MIIRIIKKFIFCSLVTCLINTQSCAMSTKFTFTTTDEAQLHVPPVPWSQRGCKRVIGICRHLLFLAHKPTTQIYDIKKFIEFTDIIIKESCSDRFDNHYSYEKHRLTCYKKLMLWEIEKREKWFYTKHQSPKNQFKHNMSF